MSNDVALNILKDLMTKLIDKFDEMPRRQEVSDDLNALATAITQITTKINAPLKQSEIKECVDVINVELKSLKTDVATISKSIGDLSSKVSKLILVASLVVGLFFLVAIFTEVYTNIREIAPIIQVDKDHQDINKKIDGLQKKIE